MTNLPQYNRLVQGGRGLAASIIGQTYSVYRLNSRTSGSIISANSLVYKTFNLYFKKASKAHIENTTFDLQVFEAMCDGTKLRVGDIIVENGYGSDGGIYCVAQLRPMKSNMLVRVENTSAIEKPHPDAGASEDQPSVGIQYKQGKMGGLRPGSRYEVTLQGGLYSVQAQGLGTLASIPVGIQPINRISDGHKPSLPTVIPRTKFLCYFPPTPGYMPSELDVLKALNQDTYQVSMVYSSEPVGLSGTISVLEKLPS